MKLKTLFQLITAVLLMGLLVACSTPESVEVIKEVEVPVEVEVIKEVEVVKEVEVEKEVEKIVEVEVTREVEVESSGAMMDGKKQPVTLNINWGTEPPSADPSLSTDTTSVDLVGNMFIGLTRFDPVTGDIIPYLATDWESGEDEEGNQTWTFNLRDDIPWVNHNPISGETTQATDDDGNPRFVTAQDVEYGVKRTLDAETGSDYSYVLYGIKNGADVNGGSEELTIDDLGVVALDDTTVQFTLESPAGYFPAIAGMWIAYPMPQWTIDEYGAKWTEAGLITTSGPYTMDSWIHGGELNLVKNPLWPEADSVQIERIEGVMITEQSTSFALYEADELDTGGVPQTEIDRVKVDNILKEEYRSTPVPCTYYYGFNNQKYPFTDNRVRRAFSYAIDRQLLIDNVTKGGQTPATTFAPPGMFGAVEPGTMGIGYDADAAAKELQAFLDEEGLSIDDFNALGVTLMHNTSEGHARIAAAIQQMWSESLGVDVAVENQEWAVYLDTIGKDTDIDLAPHIFRLGWCADYPDQNNWVHEVFNAEAGANRLRRNCTDAICSDATITEFDELTATAGKTQDPAERITLYEQAEDLLANGEAAYAPIYHYTSQNVTKPWLTRNFPTLGAADFYNWSIDMEAKNVAKDG